MMEEKTVIHFDNSSPFSNNAFTPFFYNGFEFKTMKHFLEFQKTVKFHQSQFSKAVLTSATPEQGEKFNDGLTYGDRHQWYSENEYLAYRGLMAKFKQNPELMHHLLKTKQAELAYAVSDEGYWGLGLSRAEASRLERSRWPGKNKLGNLLQKVRAACQKDSIEA